MQPKQYTVQYKGEFFTINGQGAACVGARFLNAIRISYRETLDGLIVQNQATGCEVIVKEVPL